MPQFLNLFVLQPFKTFLQLPHLRHVPLKPGRLQYLFSPHFLATVTGDLLEKLLRVSGKGGRLSAPAVDLDGFVDINILTFLHQAISKYEIKIIHLLNYTNPRFTTLTITTRLALQT